MVEDLENKAKRHGKISSDRLSNPKQLDSLLVVVTPKSWIALIALLLTALLVILWSIFGSIPLTFEGRGIVMNPEGLMYNIPAKLAGIVKEIPVKAGDRIEKDSLVAEIFDFQEELKLKKVDARLNKLQADIANAKEKAEQEEKRPGDEGPLNDQLDFQGHQKAELKKEKDFLESSLQYFKVFNPYTGRVLEVLSNVGDRVTLGQPLVRMEYLSADVVHHQFYGYFPVEQGKRIIPGMKVNIELSTVDPQEYGHLNGVVRAVSNYAISKESIAKIVHSAELANYLSFGTHAVVEVLIDVTPKSTFSEESDNFEWSSGKTPPISVTSGTVCKIQAIVEKVRPIYYILPLSSFKE